MLFVHWYGPPRPTSNRTQFVPDAIELAKSGVVSLLIDTPWSMPEYFKLRTRDEDYSRSIQQVKDLRRALDVLLAQPNVDPARVAYVGHDFGAMYGALAAAADDRVHAFVFMAGAPSFTDWFLYGAPMAPDAKQKFIDQMAPLDPDAPSAEAARADPPAVRQHGRACRPPARRSRHRVGARAKDGPLLRRRPRTQRRRDKRSTAWLREQLDQIKASP